MTTFIQVLTYVLMIAVGYWFKKAGKVSEDLGVGLATLVLDFTLPCAIIYAYRNFVFDYRLLVLCLLGLVFNVVILVIGYFKGGKDKAQCRLWMTGINGLNIGCFALPFASAFIGDAGTIACSLVDTGNAVFCLGLNMTLTDIHTGSGQKASFWHILKDAFRRPAFATYIIVLTVAALKIKVPSAVYEVTGAISKANAPMSMFMIGILTEISLKKEYLKSTSIFLALRFAVGLILSLLVFSLHFIPYDMRKGAMMVCMAPVAASSTAYLARHRCLHNLGAFTSSMAIVVSMVAIILINILL